MGLAPTYLHEFRQEQTPCFADSPECLYTLYFWKYSPYTNSQHNPQKTPFELAFDCSTPPPKTCSTSIHSPIQQATLLSCDALDTYSKTTPGPTPCESAWNKSFAISAMEIMNSLAITEFDIDRLDEFKSWCFQMFLLLEIETWNTDCILENYAPLTAVSSLFRPTLPFNLSAFTFTICYLNTSGH